MFDLKPHPLDDFQMKQGFTGLGTLPLAYVDFLKLASFAATATRDRTLSAAFFVTDWSVAPCADSSAVIASNTGSFVDAK